MQTDPKKIADVNQDPVIHLTSIMTIPHEGRFYARLVAPVIAGEIVREATKRKRLVLHVTRRTCTDVIEEISFVRFPALSRSDRVAIRMAVGDFILAATLNESGKRRLSTHGDKNLLSEHYQFTLIERMPDAN